MTIYIVCTYHEELMSDSIVSFDHTNAFSLPFLADLVLLGCCLNEAIHTLYASVDEILKVGKLAAFVVIPSVVAKATSPLQYTPLSLCSIHF